MRKVIFGILALGIMAFYYFSKPASDTTWLNGTWKIDKIVEESAIEKMTFFENGTMTFSNSERVIYNTCTYTFFTKTTIDFECKIGDKVAAFPLEVSLDNQVITMTTGNQFRKEI